MKRTISAMVGAGSQNHNNRKFTAQNVDSSRSHLNIQYCNENIRDVFHELFDEAVRKYNENQTRKDRMILDYYEKIHSGKQEKPFHELILQIGNKDDCGSGTEMGNLAAEVLDEYMKGFQNRNKSLRVFSAHLHLDEATPHLHIDFVPFTTGSKRGVETRVSLKQALASLGFKGGTRGETEWNQWVTAEKKQLELLMNQRGIEWEKKGTHEEHLSVLEYKKEQRSKEVKKLEQLSDLLTEENDRLTQDIHVRQGQLIRLGQELQEVESQVLEKKEQITAVQAEVNVYENKLEKLESAVSDIDHQISDYKGKISDILPEAGILESAAAYRKNKAKPLFVKMRDQIAGLVVKLDKMKNELQNVKKKHRILQMRNENIEDKVQILLNEKKETAGIVKVYQYMEKVMGTEVMARFVREAAEYEKNKSTQKIRQGDSKLSIHERLDISQAEVSATDIGKKKTKVKRTKLQEERL